jgi:hypothetical protein
MKAITQNKDGSEVTLERGRASQPGGTMKPFRSSNRIRIAAIAFSAVALALPAAAPVGAAGLTNCIEVTGPAAELRGCWEHVWVDGVEYRMTFFGSTKPFKGSVPTDKLGKFYVVGPQTDTPQSLGHPFAHDHVVAAAPRHNGGGYTPVYQGILVLCSEQGIVSEACVPTLSLGTPLATTVNGQPLTSVEAIEAAAAAGLVTLVPAGVLVAAISGN